MKLEVGKKAPNFKLKDQEGSFHKLSDYKGSWVLLYFYPKDFTPGCTMEACQIRDNFQDFENLKVKVLGISIDSVGSHIKFAQKYKLPFTLLSDEKKLVVKKYGAWIKKKFFGKEIEATARISFLIDPEGKIAKIYEKVNPFTHAKEVLKDLKGLKVS